MQASFSDLEYDAEKRLTPRDRFLAKIESVTPWTILVAELEPFYPKGEGRFNEFARLNVCILDWRDSREVNLQTAQDVQMGISA